MKVVIFDLDDTLYNEVDYVESAYREIAASIGHPEACDYMLRCFSDGANAFQMAIERWGLSVTVEQLLAIYRNHKPAIALSASAAATLDALKAGGVTMGLLTDGRSITQRNKVKALELSRWMKPDDILISEEFGCGKPDERCYRYFADRYPGAALAYVGDNLNKDFVTANALGWTTICLVDNGRNIFSQQVEVPERYLPQHSINDISELKNFMCSGAISGNL